VLHCSDRVIVQRTKYFKGCFVITDCEMTVAVFGKVLLCLLDSDDKAALVVAKCVSHRTQLLEYISLMNVIIITLSVF